MGYKYYEKADFIFEKVTKHQDIAPLLQLRFPYFYPLLYPASDNYHLRFFNSLSEIHASEATFNTGLTSLYKLKLISASSGNLRKTAWLFKQVSVVIVRGNATAVLLSSRLLSLYPCLSISLSLRFVLFPELLHTLC